MNSSKITIRLLPILVLISPISGLSQQTQSPCGKPPAILQSNAPNIFTEQQEQWLGDAIADHTDRYYYPIKNPTLNAYLDTIGGRLLAALPPPRSSSNTLWSSPLRSTAFHLPAATSTSLAS